MDSDFVRINIAFKPPADVAETVMKISREISQKAETYFILDNENYFPHITVYSPEYPARNLEKILTAAGNIAESSPALKLVFREVKAVHGFLGIYFEVAEEIREIHQQIVERLNLLRENHMREKYTKEYLEKYSEEQRENVAEYGHPNVMALYDPHLTITRLKDKEQAERIAPTVTWPVKEFKAENMAAFEMGSHGTCVKMVKEFA